MGGIKGRPLPPDEEVVATYLKPTPITVMRQTYGVGFDRLVDVLERNGVHDKRRGTRKLAAEEENRLIEMYRNGEPTKLLAERFQIAASTIPSIMRRRDVPRRHPSQRRVVPTPTDRVHIRETYFRVGNLYEALRQLRVEGYYETIVRRSLEDVNLFGVSMRRQWADRQSRTGPTSQHCRKKDGYVMLRLASGDAFMSWHDILVGAFSLPRLFTMSTAIGRIIGSTICSSVKASMAREARSSVAIVDRTTFNPSRSKEEQ